MPHRRVSLELAATADAAAVLQPDPVRFISYPYEWSFGQLRDAALLTLEIQERALAKGLTLRDASAYNVQFEAGRPVFIDTLSFEPRAEGPLGGLPPVLRALPGAARADEPAGRGPGLPAPHPPRRHPPGARRPPLGRPRAGSARPPAARSAPRHGPAPLRATGRRKRAATRRGASAADRARRLRGAFGASSRGSPGIRPAPSGPTTPATTTTRAEAAAPSATW